MKRHIKLCSKIYVNVKIKKNILLLKIILKKTKCKKKF